MGYSICLIDDQIPVNKVKEFDDTQLISSSMLSFLLNDDIKWEESELKALVSNILENGDISLVKAFANPQFFFNYTETTAFTPEVIIFDWNYPGINVDQTKRLLSDILQNTFTLVYIYTRVDKKHEIEEMITNEFEGFKDRLFVFHKEDEDSVSNLINGVKEKSEENFSFKFGDELRQLTQKVVNSILVELGKVSMNQISYYLKVGDENKRDLVEFIGERFKNYLVNSKLNDFEFKESGKQPGDEDLSPQIWSHRIYHYGDDDKRVRKGDVVQKDENFFLIVSANCDLNRHWHKNYGYVNLLKLHELSGESDYLKNQFLLTRDSEKIDRCLDQNPKHFKVTSLSNKINQLTDGPLLLPFLKIGDSYKHFILFPNEIFSEKIEPPKVENLKHEYLRYADGFDFKKIATISEPFLNPVIQHTLNNLGGYGTPDYPNSVQDELSIKIGEIFK